MKQLITLVLLSICLSATSQKLKIGDEVPPLEFKNLKGQGFNLYDFKSELVVIDFWASWCGSCIASWPKTDSLQKAYGDKVKFVLVSPLIGDKNPQDAIDAWVKKGSKLKNLQYVAVGDSMASNKFEFRVIPHYVVLRLEKHEYVPKYYVVMQATSLSLSDALLHAFKPL